MWRLLSDLPTFGRSKCAAMLARVHCYWSASQTASQSDSRRREMTDDDGSWRSRGHLFHSPRDFTTTAITALRQAQLGRLKQQPRRQRRLLRWSQISRGNILTTFSGRNDNGICRASRMDSARARARAKATEARASLRLLFLSVRASIWSARLLL